MYMHDDAASRKSGHCTAYGSNGGSPLPHKHKGKNEAGSPKQGEALISYDQINVMTCGDIKKSSATLISLTLKWTLLVRHDLSLVVI